jgi:hypothetical protein
LPTFPEFLGRIFPHKKYVPNLTKYGLGYILVDFFTNSSGHPVSGVAEKHDFRGIQRKIPQNSNFANDRVTNPFPHGETAADLAKMFAQIFWQ